MDDPEPLVRVQRGAATAEELAALIAVLTGRVGPTAAGGKGDGEAAAPAAPSRWAASIRHRTALRADRGPHAWRASGRPSGQR